MSAHENNQPLNTGNLENQQKDEDPNPTGSGKPDDPTGSSGGPVMRKVFTPSSSGRKPSSDMEVFRRECQFTFIAAITSKTHQPTEDDMQSFRVLITQTESVSQGLDIDETRHNFGVILADFLREREQNLQKKKAAAALTNKAKPRGFK